MNILVITLTIVTCGAIGFIIGSHLPCSTRKKTSIVLKKTESKTAEELRKEGYKVCTDTVGYRAYYKISTHPERVYDFYYKYK